MSVVQANHDENFWPRYACRHCKHEQRIYVGFPSVIFERRDMYNNRSCWLRVSCVACLSVVHISLGSPAADIAVRDLGAVQIVLDKSDPAPVDKGPRAHDKDCVTHDEYLDFMLAMRDIPDETLLEELIGGEAV